jgi:hypothetical protein
MAERTGNSGQSAAAEMSETLGLLDRNGQPAQSRCGPEDT